MVEDKDLEYAKQVMHETKSIHDFLKERVDKYEQIKEVYHEKPEYYQEVFTQMKTEIMERIKKDY